VTRHRPLTWPPSRPLRSSGSWWPPRHGAAAPPTSVSSPSWATAPPGSGTSPRKHFPEATQIVDLFHAREHVHDLASLAGRLLAGHRDDWLAERLGELDAGDIPALLAAGQDLKFSGSLASERDKALHYFETNAHRMRYDWYRSLGLFIGSGVVEAGCKSVIGQRLKLSGMRWTEPGATGILTLRCQEASNRWDQIWQRPTARHPPPEPHLSKSPTQIAQARRTYPPITYIRVPHPSCPAGGLPSQKLATKTARSGRTSDGVSSPDGLSRPSAECARRQKHGKRSFAVTQRRKSLIGTAPRTAPNDAPMFVKAFV
jgi:hypothetical protein